MLTNFTTKISLAVSFTVLTLTLSAQNSIRAFNQIFSENLRGGTTMFGNTILNIVENNAVNTLKMNETGNAANGVGGIGYSQYGNDGNNMQYADIDGVAATVNSSSADLVLPAGTNVIKFARLYWGGKIDNSVINSHPDTLRKIKIRKGTSGSYFSAVAPSINVDQYAISTTEKAYQAFIDITSFIYNNGAGTYTVADLPVTPGISSTGGKFGGWVIVVAYENLTQPYNSVRLYDGFAQVYSNGSTTYLNINLTGLNVPSTPLLAGEAVMGTMAWEGDANLGSSTTNPDGDFIKVNNITVSNAVNPATNFWNGSITKNGSFVTAKNPNYTNQMGIDIDEVNVGVGYNIQPNATSVSVQFGTEADMYFPSIFTFCIRVKDPTIVLNKTVVDANNNGAVDSQEELTYTLSGSNQGVGSSYNTYIVDTLPNNVTYVPNSLEVVNAAGVTSGFKTDAADADVAFKGTFGNKTYIKFYIGIGATGTAGGELPTGAAGNYSVRFKVKAAVIPGTVINTARIYGNSMTGDLFTDDGTAVIGEAGAPTPVKMISFNASLINDKSASLKWSTNSEINFDHFEIERSFDGINFEARGKVNGNGNGSASMTHNYEYTDNINSNAAVIYYRLRNVDIDGKFDYSRTIALKIKGSVSVENLNVYPNPFISNIKIEMNSADDMNATFRIMSFDGKTIAIRNLAVQKGNNIVILQDLGALQRGNYILEVITPSEKIVKKILKN